MFSQNDVDLRFNTKNRKKEIINVNNYFFVIFKNENESKRVQIVIHYLTLFCLCAINVAKLRSIDIINCGLLEKLIFNLSSYLNIIFFGKYNMR